MDRGLHGGEEVRRLRRDAQAVHLLQSRVHAPGGVVGQKAVRPARLPDVGQKLRRAGQQGFLQIDGAVQVQQEQLFL